MQAQACIQGSKLQRGSTHRAVAGAELIGLQAVEQTQNFLGVAAHIEVVHAHMLDDGVGVHNERGAQCVPAGVVAAYDFSAATIC